MSYSDEEVNVLNNYFKNQEHSTEWGNKSMEGDYWITLKYKLKKGKIEMVYLKINPNLTIQKFTVIRYA